VIIKHQPISTKDVSLLLNLSMYINYRKIDLMNKDGKWECLSLIGLGKCFAKLDRLDKAIENHESILIKVCVSI